jgi:hypothetical protein
MGNGRRHRRKNARREREASPAAAQEASDDVLELVFLRLTSLLTLVRAACACKRWRRIIADSIFLRRFRLLHAPALVAGHYRVDERIGHPRPPGRNPVFVPSPSPSAIDARHFSLDFLPRNVCWELADSRGGLLLLINGTTVPGEVVPSAHLLPSLVVCEPLTRRYRVIPPSAWSHGCRCFGAFLLDGDTDEAGGCISLSNFRLVCALYGDSGGVARACMFSSDGSRWTAPARRTVVCGQGYWTTAPIHFLAFAGSGGRSVYWRMGARAFLGATNHVLALDKDTAGFSSCVASENAHFNWQTEFKYQLAWPPTIRACLTL